MGDNWRVDKRKICGGEEKEREGWREGLLETVRRITVNVCLCRNGWMGDKWRGDKR